MVQVAKDKWDEAKSKGERNYDFRIKYFIFEEESFKKYIESEKCEHDFKK